tara:strand:+ start:50 stop:1516 length:1467 start_codon:yes stop_codon:yes gene_type:complete
MSSYKIAIPSAFRHNIIETKVLKLLKKHNIDSSNIYIFVSEDEISNYKTALPDYQIIEGKKGIGNQRKAISDYFDKDQWIVSLDDDVEDIYENGKSLLSLDAFINDTFNLLLANHLTLAGVYPVNNPFFCKQTITTDLRFCIGQFKMFINKPLCEYRDFELLEDYENTIKHYNYSRGVLRYNYITLKANYNKGSGGLNGFRTPERKLKEVDSFSMLYKRYCRKKKDGFEISLYKNPSSDTIKTLWIGKTLNELTELSMLSWLKLGYNIQVFSDGSLTYKHMPISFDKYKDKIQLDDADRIYKNKVNDDILPYSDIWRYKLLYKEGGTWLDADMMLLRQLPPDEIIISSERTLQSGAFKSKLKYICNIGVLRFMKGNKLLYNVIKKIENKSRKSEFCDNMKIFRKIFMNEPDINILAPTLFCSVDWWNAKELYYNDSLSMKYDVEPISYESVLEKSIGIHLWNCFTYTKHKIDFEKINPDSLFAKLQSF